MKTNFYLPLLYLINKDENQITNFKNNKSLVIEDQKASGRSQCNVKDTNLSCEEF